MLCKGAFSYKIKILTRIELRKKILSTYYYNAFNSKDFRTNYFS